MLKQLIQEKAEQLNEAAFTLTVPFVFTEDDIETILDAYNNIFFDDDDNPITIEEFKKNKRMQKYLADEMVSAREEIIESSHNAIANDWIHDLAEHR